MTWILLTTNHYQTRYKKKNVDSAIVKTSGLKRSIFIKINFF